MVIGSRQRLGTFDRSPALKIDNVLIKQVGSTKSLGVHVDKHLTWNTHISHISKKIASSIGAINVAAPLLLLKPWYVHIMQLYNHTSIIATLSGVIAVKPMTQSFKSFKIELQGFLLIRALMQMLDHYLSN